MSVKGGICDHEAYEAKKIEKKICYVNTSHRHRFYTYIYYSRYSRKEELRFIKLVRNIFVIQQLLLATPLNGRPPVHRRSRLALLVALLLLSPARGVVLTVLQSSIDCQKTSLSLSLSLPHPTPE
jgi:hypothetical protein